MASHNKTRGTKKPRSFLYKARKYGRKGSFGRGKNVDEETYNYFVRVMERLNEKFEDDDDKDIFVNNVFEQTVDKEMDLICNQVISKAVERLLPLARHDIQKKYAAILQKEMRIICTDPYGSHVLEKLMHIFLDTIYSQDTNISEEHRKFCKTWVSSVCQFAFNNVEDFIVDIYASHVLRTSLQCVSGVDGGLLLMKSHRSRKHIDTESKDSTKTYKPSEEFLTLLSDFAERLIAWPQLHDLVHSDDSSAVIQIVILSLHQNLPNLCQKLLDLLFNDIFANIEGGIFENSATIHLLEASLVVSNQENFQKLYKKYFHGHLKALAGDFETKFAVIKVIESVQEKELFTEIFEELGPVMEDLFANGSGKVVLALGNACRRLATLQAKFVQHLMETFHCYNPESRQTKLVPLISRLITYEVAYDGAVDSEVFKVAHDGTQLIVTLLHFNKPIKIVQSLLEMDTTELKDLLCDGSGSRVADAFVSAEFVGEKSREKFIQKLQGAYFSLATSKFGSRSLDAIWNSSDIKWQTVIGEELLEKETGLQGNMFGKILYAKYGLSLLKTKKADWKTMQDQERKKRKLFAGFVEPLENGQSSEASEPAKKKKKKTK